MYASVNSSPGRPLLATDTAELSQEPRSLRQRTKLSSISRWPHAKIYALLGEKIKKTQKESGIPVLSRRADIGFQIHTPVPRDICSAVMAVAER